MNDEVKGNENNTVEPPTSTKNQKGCSQTTLTATFENKYPPKKCVCKSLCFCIMIVFTLSVGISIAVGIRMLIKLKLELNNELYSFLLWFALIVALMTTIICATYLTSKIIKRCCISENESLSALNEAYDKIFGQDYSCEYKCWEKYNENPNYHYKLEKKTYKSSKPNDTQNIPTGNSNSKTAQKTPDKGAKMKTPTDITKGETKVENSTASKEN